MNDDNLDFALIEQSRILDGLISERLDENKTDGEIAVIHQEIYAVEYSINLLNKLKK